MHEVSALVRDGQEGRPPVLLHDAAADQSGGLEVVDLPAQGGDVDAHPLRQVGEAGRTLLEAEQDAVAGPVQVHPGRRRGEPLPDAGQVAPPYDGGQPAFDLGHLGAGLGVCGRAGRRRRRCHAHSLG